jgi:hypothetical protein
LTHRSNNSADKSHRRTDNQPSIYAAYCPKNRLPKPNNLHPQIKTTYKTKHKPHKTPRKPPPKTIRTALHTKKPRGEGGSLLSNPKQQHQPRRNLFPLVVHRLQTPRPQRTRNTPPAQNPKQRITNNPYSHQTAQSNTHNTHNPNRPQQRNPNAENVRRPPKNQPHITPYDHADLNRRQNTTSKPPPPQQINRNTRQQIRQGPQYHVKNTISLRL